MAHVRHLNECISSLSVLALDCYQTSVMPEPEDYTTLARYRNEILGWFGSSVLSLAVRFLNHHAPSP